MHHYPSCSHLYRQKEYIDFTFYFYILFFFLNLVSSLFVTRSRFLLPLDSAAVTCEFPQRRIDELYPISSYLILSYQCGAATEAELADLTR